jgi:hypothetical protein
MSPDQGPVQLGDLGHQLLESAMLLNPSLDLRQQFLRDVGGLGLAVDRAGQIPADVLFAGLAVAAGPAAVLGDADQGAGQGQRA